MRHRDFWLTDTISDSAVSMKNYVLFRRDRPTHAGGIAAYSNCDIPCQIVSTLSDRDIMD